MIQSTLIIRQICFEMLQQKPVCICPIWLNCYLIKMHHPETWLSVFLRRCQCSAPVSWYQSYYFVCFSCLPPQFPFPVWFGSSSTGLSASPSDLQEGNSACPKTRLLRAQSDPDATFGHVPILCVEFRAKHWERTNKARTCQATQAFTFHLNSKKFTFCGLSPWKAGVDGQRTGEEWSRGMDPCSHLASCGHHILLHTAIEFRG